MYLKFFHLSLHSKAIHYIDTDRHSAEVILSCAEPVGEGVEDTLCLFNARHLFLELFDRLLQYKERGKNIVMGEEYCASNYQSMFKKMLPVNAEAGRGSGL